VLQPATVEVRQQSEKTPWTILIYMAADNDLESEAVHDMNELESIYEKNAPYSILVLLDRAEGYDGTNGNWKDTRLYEIKRDPNGFNGTIISKQLNCPDLDLYTENNTELNMADPNTLRNFLVFARREYSAEHYALIVWGHGTGWRSANSSAINSRAVAIDDYSDAYMDLPSLKNALTGFYADVIGFDTCFGAALETAYEVSQNAAWLVASPGIIPAAGWNYADIFSRFNNSLMSAENFANAVSYSFAEQYAFESAYSISKIFLPGIKLFAESFCAFSQRAAHEITSQALRNDVFTLLMDETNRENNVTYPSDLFFDCADAVANINTYMQAAPLNSDAKIAIQNAADNVSIALSSCVTTMRAGNSANPLVSVFFTALTAPGVCAASHSPAYVKDSGFLSQSAFVKETQGWTPTADTRGSLLDTLFYKTY
jgi:hypothetical protein